MTSALLLAAACSREPVRADLDPVVKGALVFDGPAPRSLLFVSIDTLRRDHVDPLATDGVVRMPFLAERLAEGVLLADHQQCANWTLHAMTCTLLGRQVEELGWMPRLDAFESPAPDGMDTLAVRLRAEGYDPIVASSNGYFSEAWNSAQGYGPDQSAGDLALATGRGGIEALAAQRAARPAAPWFLHLFFTEPHKPYGPPEAYRAEERALPPVPWDLGTEEGLDGAMRAWPDLDDDAQQDVLAHLWALYTAEIRFLDDELAELWADLDGRGWLDDALVVFWSDHGESMLDHGQWRHGHELYREENDAFVGFWAKNLRPAVWTGPTHAIDLVPTVLAVLGVDPGDAPLPGALVGTAPADRPRFASTSGFQGPIASVTAEGRKVLVRFDGTVEQYDLAADPAERVDLGREGADDLLALLAPRLALLDAAVPETAVPP